MKKIFFILLLIVSVISFSQAQLNGKIKIYFTNPVNTSVSSGINAVHLNGSMDDTLVEYINRAKYTLDIAVYNYQQSTGMANIANAINNADARGVIVRWIYDGSQSNSGMTTLGPNIHTLGSPTTSAYGIMHNKFMIIDANATNVNYPIVWTGSTNWTKTHFNSNVNNTIIVQDKNFAIAYLAEFNEMWGGSGITPNLTNSKFGPYKTDNTIHNFTIGGKSVELYFSPSDQTNTQVINAINSANTDLYFGMLTFSLSVNSDSIISKKNNGIFTAGIIDQSSQIYSPNASLNSALGTNFKVYSQFTSVYHNKILIVDPCNTSSDPTVITGSYNWTTSAETQNDENAVIIHDAIVTNIFYQSFYQNFSDLGGTLAPCAVATDLSKLSDKESEIMFFPNPASGKLNLKWDSQNNIDISIFNSIGQEIATIAVSNQNETIDITNFHSGFYFLKIKDGNTISLNKIFIKEN